MRISDIQITPPLGQPNRDWVLLKIRTDEGIEGLGEWAPSVARERLDGPRKALIGQDPMNINSLHHGGQPDRGLWDMGGLGAGVEIALWDIVGKVLGAPLWQLLGGRLRDQIRMYCDCHAGDFWTREGYAQGWHRVRETGKLDRIYEPDAYVEMAKRVVAEGFTAVKFDVDVPNPWKLDTFDRSISRRSTPTSSGRPSRCATPSDRMWIWPSIYTVPSTLPTHFASAKTWSTWTYSGWRTPCDGSGAT